MTSISFRSEAMEVKPTANLESLGGYEGLQQRIESGRANGGTMYSIEAALELLDMARANAQGRTVPVELLLNAMEAIVYSSTQGAVGLSTEMATALADLAYGSDRPPIPQQTSGSEFELIV